MFDIPYQLFLAFFGISFVLLTIGLMKKAPVFIVSAGMFLLPWILATDNIIMGSIPVASATSGSVTTYTFENDLFQLTDLPKVLLALIASMFMLVGGLMYMKESN